MKHFSKILLLGTALLIATGAQAKDVSKAVSYGPGAIPCGDLVEDFAGYKAGETDVAMYITGFGTAINYLDPTGPVNIFSGTPVGTLVAAVFQYCRENPKNLGWLAVLSVLTKNMKATK